MKLCTKCGSEGPFRYNATTKDGLSSWCNLCHNAASKACRLKRLDHYREVNRRRYRPVTAPQERTAWRRWTLEDEDLLVEHWRGRHSNEPLAHKLGRTPRAVHTHAVYVLELRADGNDWRKDEDFEVGEAA